MTINSQRALERDVQRIYEEANDYADLHGGIQHGMNVLYGPPILKPKVMIVSVQGGGADGKSPQTTWPSELAYLDGRHEFGRRLIRDFDNAGLGQVLRQSTVATNLAFPQAAEFGKWQRTSGAQAWLEKSASWAKRLIMLMDPTMLLTYGTPSFERLTSKRKRCKVEETQWNGMPLVGCGHLTRGARREERADAMERVKRLIGSQDEPLTKAST